MKIRGKMRCVKHREFNKQTLEARVEGNTNEMKNTTPNATKNKHAFFQKETHKHAQKGNQKETHKHAQKGRNQYPLNSGIGLYLSRKRHTKTAGI